MNNSNNTTNNNNNSREDWTTLQPRIESSLQKLKSELEDLRNSDKDLLKKFIKMRSEIKELSKESTGVSADEL